MDVIDVLGRPAQTNQNQHLTTKAANQELCPECHCCAVVGFSVQVAVGEAGQEVGQEAGERASVGR